METLSTLFDSFRHSSLYMVYTISLDMFIRLWYFLAIGIVIGSIISAYIPKRKLSSLARQSGVKGILVASLVGAASPLDSYAVIPIFTAMLASGLPRAPVMAFLASSPLINPIMFFWTWTVINPPIAVARLVSTITLGILCGLLVDYFTQKGFIVDEALQAAPANPGPQEGLELSAFPEEEKSASRLREALVMMWKTAKYPGRYFLIAIVLAALVETYVPTDAIVRYMGDSKTSVLIATAMSIPFYVCGGGAIPLVAQFLNMGMNKGAALAFFLVGPATRIAPMVTVLVLVRKKIFLVYFLVILLGGMGLGLLYGVL
ncbi:MAG: permease [Deltaproteobacteria bacterium]|nr:MAG: permease [Deltaproteobacteria bacterium]